MADGHELRDSGTTTTVTADDVPGHGDFILNAFWQSPVNVNLWQGGDGINNPCPSGFMVPTQTEWQNEINSWGAGNDNAAGALASPLKLVGAGAGVRSRATGSVIETGSFSYYWTSSLTSSATTVVAYIGNFIAGTNESTYTGLGHSVRCIKD